MSKSISEDLVELSLDELSAVRGAQSTERTPANELSDQFSETLKSWGDFVAPVLAPVRETVKLAYAADRYLAFAYEHQYPALSQSHADRVNQDKADKAKHEQEDRDHALQGSKPTSAADVAVWLDSTNPGPPPDISVPTWMTEAPHEAEISIEPLDTGGANYDY
jgi:hypothetical protein